MNNNNSNDTRLSLWLTFFGGIIVALITNWDKIFPKTDLPKQKMETQIPPTYNTTSNGGDTYNGSQVTITENNNNKIVIQPTKQSEIKTFALQNVELLPYIVQIQNATKYQHSKQSATKISVNFEPDLKQLENGLFTYDGGYLSIGYDNQKIAIPELKLNLESQHGNNQDFVLKKINQQIQKILKDSKNHSLIVNKIISCLK